MIKIEIIYYWKDGYWCYEEDYPNVYYKHPWNPKTFIITNELKDYEIDEYVYFYLNKNYRNKKKGFRNEECGIDNCKFDHNTFYKHKNTGIYYCRKCALLINFYNKKEIVKYELPKLC